MRQSPIFILFVCFLIQNVTSGFAFGSFGPLLAINEAHFAISRGVAAAGMSATLLAIGIISPIAGNYINRISAERAILYGILASAAGYGLLAVSRWFESALVGYSLIGAGVALSGILGPYSIISNTFVKNRAKALSFINLPLMLLVAPYLTASLLPGLGRTLLYVSIGSIFLLLALIVALALKAPKRSVEMHNTERSEVLSTKTRLLPNPPIWLLAIGVGIVAGTGAAYYVHAVPYGIGRGLSLQAASGLVSSYAGAGIFGTLLFGWIADRIGPTITLTLSAALQAPLWWILFAAEGNQLFLIAAFLGMCAVPQNTLLGATSSALFGHDGARAMGLCFAIKLPFLFGFAPLLGILFETSNDYRLAFSICALTLILATLSLGLLWVMTRNTRQADMVCE